MPTPAPIAPPPRPSWRRGLSALAALLVALAALLVGGPRASADDAAPKPPGKVVIGFYVYNIRDLNLAANRFGVDFYMWMRYRGEQNKVVETLEFVNGRIDMMEVQERGIVAGETYVCWKVAGTFQAKIALRNYPFDVQHLDLVIEHPHLEADQLAFVHDEQSYNRSPSPTDRKGIKNGISVADFRVVGTERRTERYAYESDFGKVEGAQMGSAYSRLVLSIRLQRIYAPYFYKILFPFLLLIGMAYIVFWIPPQELVASAGIAMTSLITSVIFELSVSYNLPDAGYLIVSDKFFLATLVLIIGSLIHSVVTFNLAKQGRERLAWRVEVAARVAYPIAYVAIFGFLLRSAIQAEG